MKKTMSCLGAAAALTLGALVAAPGAASAVTPTPTMVTFDGETSGTHPEPYATAAQPDVRFFDLYDTDVYVADVSPASHGLAVASATNGYSGLDIRLTGPTTSLSLAFGYDYGDTSDQGQLTLYRGATQVGQVEVNINANGVMDQRIGYNEGRLFTRAVFQYVDGAGAAKDLPELVDDIKVAPICTIAGNSGHNLLRGTSHRDVICGDSGNDTIRGNGGHDLIYPGPGRDNTSGGSGADTVIDIAGNDTLNGNGGADDLRAGIGRDRVFGGAGNDRLNGGPHRDLCNGQSGHDVGVGCEVRRRIP